MGPTTHRWRRTGFPVSGTPVPRRGRLGTLGGPCTPPSRLRAARRPAHARSPGPTALGASKRATAPSFHGAFPGLPARSGKRSGTSPSGHHTSGPPYYFSRRGARLFAAGLPGRTTSAGMAYGGYPIRPDTLQTNSRRKGHAVYRPFRSRNSLTSVSGISTSVGRVYETLNCARTVNKRRSGLPPPADTASVTRADADPVLHISGTTRSRVVMRKSSPWASPGRRNWRHPRLTSSISLSRHRGGHATGRRKSLGRYESEHWSSHGLQVRIPDGGWEVRPPGQGRTPR